MRKSGLPGLDVGRVAVGVGLALEEEVGVVGGETGSAFVSQGLIGSGIEPEGRKVLAKGLLVLQYPV